MSTRPVLRILALLGTTLLLHYLLSLLVWQPTDADVLLAWVLQPLGSIVAYTWACYAIWGIAVVAASIRLRGSRPAPRVLWLAAGTFVASSLGPLIVAGTGVALAGGANPSDAGLVLFVAMVTAIPFMVAALLSILIVELGFGRPRTVRTGEPAATAPMAG